MSRRTWAMAVLVVLGLRPESSQAQGIDPSLWVTNGTVSAVARDGNTVYVGGGFTHVGPSTGGWVPIDENTGLVTGSFPQVTGAVYVITPDGSGGWYLGGNFTAVGGFPRSNIAHIASNLTVSAWNPGADGIVVTIVPNGSVVYAGGLFGTIGGQARTGIGALDASTGSATAWNPNANGEVDAIVVDASLVYVCGRFTSIGGQTRNRVACLNVSDGLATPWNPDADGHVRTMVKNGSTIYVGGAFGSIGGASRSRVAALDASSASATTWNPAADGFVERLVVSGSTIYAGGPFTNIGGAARSRIAALDDVLGLATSWNPNANSTVRDIVVQVGLPGPLVYIAGSFTSVGGQPRRGLAAIHPSTGVPTAWNPTANDLVNALALGGGGTLYAGGFFTSVGGVLRNNLAAFDATTGAATAWNPDVNNTVRALGVVGNTLYAAGDFTSVGGQTRNRIAAVDVASGVPTSWNPNADLTVWSMAFSGSTVYAGGQFTIIGGQPRNRIAALDVTTGLATAWNPNADVQVLALAASGSTVYAGGDFATIGGQSRNRIAALDATSGLATAWNPDADATVRALVPNGTTVLASGAFTSIGGQVRFRIASLDATTGLATGWNPSANNPIYAIAKSGTTVYAAGAFTNVGGSTRNRIAALNDATGVADAWNPGAGGGVVFALAVYGTTVYAGGAFTSMGGEPKSYVAAVNASPVLTSVTPASGGNAGPVTATVHGSGLVGGGTIRLENIVATQTPGTILSTASDGTSQTATFDLSGAAAGPWSVVATMPDAQSATLSGAFTIEAVQGPQLRVAIVGTSLIGGSPAVRRDRRTAFDLVIENPGNVDAVSVPLWLAGVPLDATVETDFLVSYPPQSGGEPSWSAVPAYFTTVSGKYVPVVIPRVPPGTTTRRFWLTVPGPTHPPFELIAAVAPPWVNGEVFRSCLSSVVTNGACLGAQLDAIGAHLAASPHIETLSAIALWAKVAWNCEGAASLPAALAEAEQALDFMAGAIETGSATAGCENVTKPQWRDVQTVSVVGSVDPNDKLGLAGTLSGQVVLPYSIRFENFATATAPAQDVIVTDQLDGSVLDLGTVSLDQIAFGNRRIFPPPGLASYSTTVDLRPEKNLLVNVSASLDPVTHVLSWYFNSIDPATGRTPTDFQMGFLPPNVTPPQGEGSVLFTVMPKAGLSSGTQICNAASILFDDPPATITPSWLNGVDNSPPASHVLPLAPQSHQSSINVSWTADGSPPDLRDFTIYVKQDAGPYRVWRLNTTATSDTLKPPPDHQLHTFTFYSVARDLLGNIEAPPPTPDATTQSTTAVDEAIGPLDLALAARPNPVAGPLQVWLTLPSRDRATLELLDVAGRRVARREVGALGPGSHLVTLAAPPRAGLYFLRLAQGSRVLRTRVAVLQ
jgi:trimeric autotransporter adhesin